MTNLTQELAEMAEKSGMPDEMRAVIARAMDEVDHSGVAPGLAIGDTAGDFTLPDATGEPVTLSDRLADGPVVLSFYRGDWCSYCNVELRAQHMVMPEIRELGATLITISPQSPDHAAGLLDGEALDFDVLSDKGQTVAAAYRVRFTLPAALRDLYENTFKLDISKVNAGGEWDLPVPATFVIDRAGTVAACHVSTDYATRMDPTDILAALRELR